MGDRMAFGVELRRRRLSAGLSLGQLAAIVHYSKGYLSKIESGDKLANPALARLCDAAVGANGELVGLTTETNNSIPDDEEDFTDLGTDPWHLRLDPDGRGHFVRADGAPFDSASAFGPSPGSVGLPADPSVLPALFTTRLDQARSLGQLVSSAFILPTLIAETHALRGFARYAQGENGAALWRLAARFAEFTGWMVQELGDNRLAIWWTDYAVRMAARGGDESMRPYALFRRADISLSADDPLRVIDLAQRAEADPAATARIRGLAAQREAQGYALLVEANACFEALDRSAALLAEAERQAPAEPILGTTRTPNPTTMCRGWCLFDLGQPAEAAVVLEAGLPEFSAEARRARARYALRTALAHAAADNVDRACEIVTQLADGLRQLDSATARHDVRLIHRELRRRPNHPGVQDVLPVLAELLRGPAAPDPG